MKYPRTLSLDFVGGTGRPQAPGVILCACGLAVAAGLGMTFNSMLIERASLEAQVDALKPAPLRVPSAAQVASAAAASRMKRALSIPWTPLLRELEAASNDMNSQVSLLQVQPDPDKHLVRITAEVRTLADALAYLQRLQHSALLRYPMLESHERVKDDPEHPLRIKLSADWRL